MFESQERTPIAKAALSVLLPAHNTEPELRETVQKWTEYLATRERDCEILIIDHGSTDGTKTLADQLAGENPRVRVLSLAEVGIGAALRAGLVEAKHSLVCLACDPRQAPATLQRLFEQIDSVDVVCGFRAGRQAPGVVRAIDLVWWWLLRIAFGITLEPRPGWLGWPAQIYHVVIRWCFGVRIADIDCPLKLFRRALFRHFTIQSSGPFVHAEILAKANFLGCLMAEVKLDEPADWLPGDRLKEALRVFNRPDFKSAPALCAK